MGQPHLGYTSEMPTNHPRWSREPYRLAFPAAMAAGVGALLWWVGALAGRGAALAAADHGLLMIYGVLGTAVVGFLATAWPRQNNGAPLPPAIILALGGVQIGFVVGLLWSPARLIGLGLAAIAWAALGIWAAAIAIPGPGKSRDPTSAWGPGCLLAAAAGMGLAAMESPSAGANLGLHGFLLPLALLLLDRLLPFFSKSKIPIFTGRRRPGFALPLLVLGIGRGLAMEGSVVGALDLALLLLIARQWQGWRPDQALRPALVGVLHLGVAWILAGYLVDLVAIGSGSPPGLLARHLWTVGGLGTLVFSIAIRVTRGHANTPLLLGKDGAILIGLVQLACLARLGAHLSPGLAPLAVAAGLLGLAFLGWLVRLGPLVRQG